MIDVLSSDLLPPKMEDVYIKDAIKTISNPNTIFYKRMIDAIFDSPLYIDSDKLMETENEIKEAYKSFTI